MSGRHERSMSNVSQDQKVGRRASERFWPMLQPMGKDREGRMQTREIYVDMHSAPSGEEKTLHYGEGGWNDTPPNLPSGAPGVQACWQPPSETYRRNFAKIDWSR